MSWCRNKAWRREGRCRREFCIACVSFCREVRTNRRLDVVTGLCDSRWRDTGAFVWLFANAAFLSMNFLLVLSCRAVRSRSGTPSSNHLKTSFPVVAARRVSHCRRSVILSEFRDFLELSYGELEDLNLAAKEQRRKRVAADVIREERLKYLTDERRIKAVTGLFSHLQG